MPMMRLRNRVFWDAVEQLVDLTSDGETTENLDSHVDCAPQLAPAVEHLEVASDDQARPIRDEWARGYFPIGELLEAPMLVSPNSGEFLGKLDGEVVVGVALIVEEFVVVRQMRRAYDYEERWYEQQACEDPPDASTSSVASVTRNVLEPGVIPALTPAQLAAMVYVSSKRKCLSAFGSIRMFLSRSRIRMAHIKQELMRFCEILWNSASGMSRSLRTPRE